MLKRVSLPIGSLYYVNAIAITLFFFGSAASDLPYTRGVVSSTTFLPLVLVLSKVNKARFPKLIEKMSIPRSSWWLRFMPAGALILATAVKWFFDGGFACYFGSAAILQWFIFDCVARGKLPAAFSCLQRVKHLRAILVTGIVLALLEAFQNVGFVTVVAPLVLGSLQIPVSMTRIMLAVSILVEDDFDLDVPDNKTHLVQVLKAFYILVLCQGILYILACILESFSYFPRRSLALRCGLVDKVGLESISLYYEQAYDTFVQESVLDAKDMSLVTFAVDSLNSEVSHDKKLAAVRILHSFLQKQHHQRQQDGQEVETSNTRVVSEITGSTKAVTTLISMLGSIVPEDADIRLFAAKVVADLARYLRITGIPGTMQMVSSLLDVANQPGRDDSSAQRVEEGYTGNAGNQELREASGSPRVDSNGENAGDQEIGHASSSATVDPEQGNADNQAISHRSSSVTVNDNGVNAVDQQIIQNPSSSTLNAENNDNQSRIQDYPVQAARKGSRIRKIYQDVKKLWSVRHDSLKGEESFPVLGLLILGSFADDVDNCAEISRETQVLPKIIGLVSHITSTTTPHQKHVTTSSLVLLAKLASVEWKSGVTLRKELSENPFLLSKLAEILADSCSGPEQWKPAMDIIAKLAMDDETRQEIGGIQVIISKLMHVFLGRDEASNTYDPSLRTAAGQALEMLAMESAGNCSAILDEPVYNTIVVLSQMFTDYENEYRVANILQSLLAHSRGEPRYRNRLNDQMSSGFIVEVVGRIMGAEGKRMEGLVGLASQICNVVPELFIHDLEMESHLDAAAFVQKLVNELKADKRPSPEFPRMRRSLVELTISMVQSCSRYAAIFRDHSMVEALSKVEKTPSKVEKYRLFYGSVGVVPEGGGTLSNLVATAKGLIV